ncbi:MAG: hypothetical protein BMS9Abin13_661 [Patescibacteria group bacterium]|nr:MAG: hypothetical protein BMS9Abin13_661 [Patescibacteria group bacterium]
MFRKNNKKYASAHFQGFTIIELLVSISIIVLLSSVVILAVNKAGAASRDTVRKSEIRQLERALEFHYDKYGSYTQPETRVDDTSSSCGTPPGADWCSDSNLRILVTDEFMDTLPKDPVNSGIYRYTYEPWDAGQGGYPQAGQAYDLCATLEGGGVFCVNKRN